MTRSWHSNVVQQTMVRAATKLELAWGLATTLAEAINDKSPAVQQILGELWCYAELARAAVQSAEEHCNKWGNGLWFPDGPPLMALKAMMPFWMPRANEIIKLLGSHNLLATPTWHTMKDPEPQPFINKYMHEAGETSAERRILQFRLVWEQYERFYLTSGARNQQRAQSLACRDAALA